VYVCECLKNHTLVACSLLVERARAQGASWREVVMAPALALGQEWVLCVLWWKRAWV
jgi:hypothetical protein